MLAIIVKINHQNRMLYLCALTNLVSLTAAVKCTTTSGCPRPCGACDAGECFFTYNNRYDPRYRDLNCTPILLPCLNRTTEDKESKVTTCNSPDGGKCALIEDTHIASCVCEREYFGGTCEYRKEGGGAGLRSLTIKHIDYVNPCKEHNLTVVVLGETMDDFVRLEEITVTTNEGYYKKIKPSGQMMENKCTEAAMACIEFDISDFKVSFKEYERLMLTEQHEPAQRYDSNGDRWFSADINEIGGVRRNLGLKIRAVQNKLMYSSVSLDMFVNYGTFERVVLICAPSIIKITNCERRYNTPLEYTRSSAIVIENEVTFLENGGFINTSFEDIMCAKNAITYWRIDQTKDVSEQGLLRFSVESYTEYMMRLEPFTLPLGSYRAYWEWTAVQQDTVKNFAFCYFDVIEEPLVAIISGSSDRMVLRHHGLLLSAEMSYDPNYYRSEMGQIQLRAKWHCKRVPDTPDPLCHRWTQKMPILKPYFIKADLLTPSAAVYNFTLEISSEASYRPKPQYAHVRIEVALNISAISIKCVVNCGAKVVPNQILFIKAKSANTSQYTDLIWVYYKNNNQLEERPTDTIKEQNLPPHMLIIKEHTLEMGTEYTVEVLQNSTGARAKYSFRTAMLAYEGNCTVEPGQGVKGKTYFDIVCTHNETLLYEFYDKTPDEASMDIMFSGRMLGSSSDGKLLDVRLSRGTVVIYLIDGYGLSVNRTLQVELSYSDDNNILEHLLSDLTDSHKRHTDISNILRLISVIADLVPSNINTSIILYRLGQVMAEIPVPTLQEGKLSISTLSNVLISLNRHTHVLIKTYMIYQFQELIRDQTEIIKTSSKRPYTSRWMSPKEVKQLCKYSLNSLYFTFKRRDIKTEGVDIDVFSLKKLIELKYCSVFMGKAIDNVKEMLSFLQAPGQSPTTISIANDSFIVWVISNDDEDMPLTRTLKNYKQIPVVISESLLKVLNKNIKLGQQLSLQVVSVKDNIFWWRKSDILSNLVSTSLAVLPLTEKYVRITYVKPPLEMFFNMVGLGLDKTIVNGHAIQLDNTRNVLNLDLAIHRIDLPPKCLLTLTFLFPQTNGSLHLSVTLDTRPEYESVKNSSIWITENSPSYTAPYDNNIEPIYLYVGILPSSEVSVNGIVSYTFTITTKVCQTWMQGLWSSEGCRTRGQSAGKGVYCECNHLSFCGVATPPVMTSSSIDILESPKLFVTVLGNPHFVAFIVAILIIYLIMCFIMRHRDSIDRNMNELVVLEDNFPRDPYPYLIAVYTSPRYNAGTTAQVGFRLIGTAASSRAHVFRCCERKVLRRGCDDWFLIFTHDYLHEINFMHLWHDNAGRSPTWYCNEIFVYDLSKSEQYQFVVGEWMALRTNSYPEIVCIPLKENDANEIKRVFNENVYLGMRDNHMILSIMYSHPRSQVTKVQRLSICMCGLMASLLYSIMYHKSNHTNLDIDDYHFTITLNDVVVSFQNLLLKVIVRGIVFFLFRRTREYKEASTINTTRTDLHANNTFKPKSMTISNRSMTGETSKVPSACASFRHIVIRIFKCPPLQPVYLHHKEPYKTRKLWLIIAWVFCASLIVVLTFLVMRYGLMFGPVKSKKWLSTAMLTMAWDFSLYSPTKILISSVLLAVVFQRVFEINTYTISLHDIKLVQRATKKTKFQDLFDKRNSWIYVPLYPGQRKKILNKYKERLKWWLSIDFLLSTSFLIVTSAVVSKLWSDYYFNNYYILWAITKPILPNVQSHDLYSVKSVADLEMFLGSSFLHGIYSTRWYNNDHLDECLDDIPAYWLIDGINRMIGRPKIRQLRVLPEIVTNYVIPQFYRNPDWSRSKEDTGVYSERWKSANWRLITSNDSAWKFFDSTLTPIKTLFRLYSASRRLFHNGGFNVNLGPREIDAENTLSDLLSNKWLDMRTKVVFVELTVYNVNYDLFTQVTLIVEYLSSGKVMLKVQGTSLRSSVAVNAWHVAFLLYIVYYVVRSFLLVNEQGITDFLLGIKNILRLIIIILTLAAFASLGLHIHTLKRYTTKFQIDNLDIYFDFDTFTVYFFIMKTLFSFLVFATILHLLFHMNFGRSFFNISYVLLVSLKWLFWMILIIYTHILTLTNVAHLLDIDRTILAQDIMLHHQLMRKWEIVDTKSYSLFLFVSSTAATICIYKAVFFVLFYNTVKLVRFKRIRYSSRFNIALFILSKLKRRQQTEKNKICKDQ